MARKRFRPDAFDLCGLIFSVVGLPFLCFGVWAAFNMDYISAHGEGDVWVLPVVFCVLGLTASALGLGLLYHSIRKRSNRKRIVAANNFVFASVTGVVPDFSVRVNGRPSTRVLLSYTDPFSGQEFRFSSDPMFGNLPDVRLDDQVKVYVDRDDFTDYVVDL